MEGGNTGEQAKGDGEVREEGLRGEGWKRRRKSNESRGGKKRGGGEREGMGRERGRAGKTVEK